MNRATLYLSMMGLAALLTGGAWAQEASTTIQPVSTYIISVAYEQQQGLSPTVTSPITDQATLGALWTNMAIRVPVPTIDFTKQLVVVSSTKENTAPQSLTLDAQGNLTVAEMNVSLYAEYVISVISSAGITSVNDVPLPTESVPVPILRSASDGTRHSFFTTREFLTITDERTWEGTWPGHAQVAVDFTKEEVLFVVMGETFDGSSIAITGVTETAQRLTATVEEKPQPIPPTSEELQQRSSSPYIYPCAAAIIPKSEKPVYFADSAVGGTVVPIISTIPTEYSRPGAAGGDTVVIKDVAAWKELYNKRITAGEPLPDVNFSKDMVLAVFVGKKGLSSTTISQVIEIKGKLQVDYYVSLFPILMSIDDLTEHDGMIPYTQHELVPTNETVIPNTYTAVIVPKSDLPVTFTQVAGPAGTANMVTPTLPTTVEPVIRGEH